MASKWRHIPTEQDVAYNRRECQLAEQRGYFGYEWRTWRRIPRHVDKSLLEDRWIEVGLTDERNHLLPPAADTRKRIQVFKVPMWPAPNAVPEHVGDYDEGNAKLPGATLRRLGEGGRDV
jgi:hypothetical protein